MLASLLVSISSVWRRRFGKTAGTGPALGNTDVYWKTKTGHAAARHDPPEDRRPWKDAYSAGQYLKSTEIPTVKGWLVATRLSEGTFSR
jgi:hypothetical protein